MDFAIPAGHWENQRKRKANQGLGLCLRTKNLWNMNVTVIPILTGVLGSIPKGLLRELEELEILGIAKTIQTTALLRSPRIQRRVLGSLGDFVIQTSVKDLANASVKNS